MMNKAFFLDRDGVVIRQISYLHDPELVELYPGTAAAVKELHRRGYLALVVTNQSGVARGLFGVAEVEAVHQRIQELLAADGEQIDGFFTCFHHPDFGSPCSCRKPLPGLLFQAAERHQIDLASSFMVGDKFSDLECGRAGGCRQSILVETGYGAKYRQAALQANFAVAADLAAAVRDFA